MSGPVQPWEGGDANARWRGYLDTRYFDPQVGEYVMRNLVGATSYAELRVKEDAWVALRSVSMVGEGIPKALDLDGLCSIHRHLFQDVYPWAGEVRTVDIGKGAGPFRDPAEIRERMERLADGLAEVDYFRGLPREQAAEGLALAYNEVNATHAFREGNGRTQREFVSALARESGHVIDWQHVQGPVNDVATERARHGDMTLLRDVFRHIVRRPPVTLQDRIRAQARPTQGHPPVRRTTGGLGGPPAPKPRR